LKNTLCESDIGAMMGNCTWGLDPAGTTQEIGGIGALLETEVVNQDKGSSAYY
jgi:hypothetical protein